MLALHAGGDGESGLATFRYDQPIQIKNPTSGNRPEVGHPLIPPVNTRD